MRVISISWYLGRLYETEDFGSESKRGVGMQKEDLLGRGSKFSQYIVNV